MPELFVDISAHGLGHLAQTAPVLNALQRARPELRITVRSGLPPDRLAARIAVPFEFIPAEPDFGYVMRDALDIDLAGSASRYRERHGNWFQAVAAEADFLRRRQPDLVLSNVAYLPLAGAARAGIPAVAMCSLNWADLFAHYFGKEAWAGAIYDEMLSAYRGASAFLRITPGMPMVALHNLHPIGPVAAVITSQRLQIAERLGLPLTERWVLVGLGGIEHRLPVTHWPRLSGVRWLVADDWQAVRDDISVYDKSTPFAAMLASADALITKTGYGSFAESACNGVPVLYLGRPDWPEQPALVEWLREHNRCVEITRAEASSGAFACRLEEMWQASPPPRPLPSGIDQACVWLSRMLAE
ncbi:MAG: hypothetical protein WC073_06600 [Sterolibacterium sp.]